MKQQQSHGYVVLFQAILTPFILAGMWCLARTWGVVSLAVDRGSRFLPAPLTRLIAKVTAPGTVLSRLERQSRKIAPKDLLVAGKAREWIESIAPPATNPLLYRVAPPELAYSLVSDGRALNGLAPARALGPSAITESVVLGAYNKAVKLAITAALFVVLLGLLVMSPIHLASLLAVAPSTQATALQAPEQAESSQPVFVMPTGDAAQYTDVWAPVDAERMQAKISRPQKVGNAAAATVRGLIALSNKVVLLLGLAAVAYSLARVVWLAAFRGGVWAVAEARAKSVRIDARDALQRWRWRREQKINAHAALADAIDTISHFDRSPTIELGVASGTMAYRGHLDAPMPGAPIRMSVTDATQHILVIGATGEGKSRSFVTPLLKQLLDMRQAGLPVAVYLTDDKGVLWADLAAEANQRKLPVRVIGTAPGQLRVDLLGGVEPSVFADVMRSVAKQIGGARSDDFWPDMASDMVTDTATILQAYEHTDAGVAKVRASGMRMYSINRILHHACTPDDTRQLIIELASALKDDDQYPALAKFDRSSLHAAIESYQGFWAELADATLTGIQANVRQALRKFAFSDELSHGFADGSGEDLLSLDDLHGNHLTAINVSAIEHGLAGKLVNVLLKTILFRAARAAEARDPSSSAKRLAWWSNPGKEAAKDVHAWTFFIGDEYQSLATPGGTGVDDATFWNLSRSAGIVGVLLSQSISAFEMTLGREATKNMFGNLRTKIFMRTEDTETIEYVRTLAGRSLRFESLGWGAHDSQLAARFDGKADPDNLPAVEVDLEGLAPTLRFDSIQLQDYADVHDHDGRFIERNDDQETAQRQAAMWRYEDRNAAILTAGRQDVDTVRAEDLMSMGRGRAIAFVQRAGVTRVDMIDMTKRVAATA
jgi:hypothetical protein